MRLIRMAMLLGLIAAIPICALIYLGVSQLERGVRQSGEMRETLREIAEMMNPILVESASEDAADSLSGRTAGAYPFSRTIANRSGQQLDVVVTGRDEEALHFLSLRDNRPYRYPISGLSDADRGFAAALPATSGDAADYPVTRQLSDRVGRSLVAVIEGRTEFDLHFQAIHDGSRHVYPISRLAAADRDFVFGLPVNRSRPTALHPVGSARSRLSGASLRPHSDHR